jgi:acetyl-CoA carboxylase biotin carboxyl carrier protein
MGDVPDPGRPVPADAGAGPARASLGVADLIALVDRLEELLERSALDELEVEAGGTALILRRPSALVPLAAVPPGPSPSARTGDRAAPPAGPAAPTGLHVVAAPLTGVYYASPSPGAAPYVSVGDQVSAGQVIGLIEAMKLFNEIKSDVSGTVHRIAAENGALVKAKQALIEVEPG